MDKECFLKVYANLPLNLRDEIVVVIDGDPITWRVAHLEISGDTPTGERIYTKLRELKII